MKDEVVEKTLLHLEEYAAEGLRTLCLSIREVPEDEYREWQEVYNTAQTTVSGNRAEELDKAAELIEHDFTLLGATAIEDKLQEGVPDTIHTLQTAGIKVWVLTGDRQETAINIGMSCKLISEDMTLLIVNEENSEATRSNIQKKLDAINSQRDAGAGGAEMETLALVIDGKSLTFALEKDMEKLFLDLATMCKAVICCRVSPLQKALVVKLVKKHLKSILLAIGDGANDVSMIQAAHIGIGISGVEGLQAARSADVSIAQFRYLRKTPPCPRSLELPTHLKSDPLLLLQKHRPLHNAVLVLLPKRLLRPSHLRILDPVLLQRHLHRTPALLHRDLRPIRQRQTPRPISATLPTESEGRLLPHPQFLVLGRQRLLPLITTLLRQRAPLVGRRRPLQRRNRRPLGLGYRPLHRGSRHRVRQSSHHHQHLDQIPLHRHPRLLSPLVPLLPPLGNHRPALRRLDGVCEHSAGDFLQPQFLPHGFRSACVVFDPRFRVEVCQEDVFSPELSSCAGDSEV